MREPDGSVSPSRILADLKALRSGSWVSESNENRIGPALRTICPRLSRSLLDDVIVFLRAQVRELDEPAKTSVTIGLGLTRDTSGLRLQERLARLAPALSVSPRTADRRLDNGLARLAGRLAAQHVDPSADSTANSAPAEWHFRRFDALLRMDADRPEAIERRTVVVTKGSIVEIDTSISIPRHRDDRDSEHSLEVVLLHGGRLELREQEFETHFRQVIKLNSPLRAGHEHEYSLMMRVPRGQRMAPHYVYVPHRRCDRFRLCIRFDPDRLPRDIWRLDGAPSAAIYEERPARDILVPDSFGEVVASFDTLRTGLSYGMCWIEATEPGGPTGPPGSADDSAHEEAEDSQDPGDVRLHGELPSGDRARRNGP